MKMGRLMRSSIRATTSTSADHFRPAEASHRIVPEHCDTVKHSWESEIYIKHGHVRKQ